MAMTKAERAEVDALRMELAKALAFRCTEPVHPDIPAPKCGEPRTEGWVANPAHTYSQVKRAWSEHHMNGLVGCHSRSQNGIALFSTEELAWRYVRHALEQEFAAQMVKIDENIAQARAAAQENPSA